MSREDAALLQAWRLGDRRAGDLLVERYYPRVARFFRDAVNDAVQEDLLALEQRYWEGRAATDGANARRAGGPR